MLVLLGGFAHVLHQLWSFTFYRHTDLSQLRSCYSCRLFQWGSSETRYDASGFQPYFFCHPGLSLV